MSIPRPRRLDCVNYHVLVVPNTSSVGSYHVHTRILPRPSHSSRANSLIDGVIESTIKGLNILTRKYSRLKECLCYAINCKKGTCLFHTFAFENDNSKPSLFQDYKEECDPRLYKSQKTGRGPLNSLDWQVGLSYQLGLHWIKIDILQG